MCEPTHSITQFPPSDGPNSDRTVNGLQRVMDLAKKIAGWFHFSKLGKGHSESLDISVLNSLWIDFSHAKYEALWWERRVRFDGYQLGEEYDKEYALGLADTYAHQVSIGNMTQLRRFLSVSMHKSDVPQHYLTRFRESLLNQQGRVQIDQRLRSAFGKASLASACSDYLDKVIAIMLGFTRKAELVNDAWAHVLLTPDQTKVAGLACSSVG